MIVYFPPVSVIFDPKMFFDQLWNRQAVLPVLSDIRSQIQIHSSALASIQQTFLNLNGRDNILLQWWLHKCMYICRNLNHNNQAWIMLKNSFSLNNLYLSNIFIRHELFGMTYIFSLHEYWLRLVFILRWDWSSKTISWTIQSCIFYLKQSLNI